LAEQAAWYIAHAGEDVSDRFVAAVERALQALLEAPGVGAPRRYRGRGLSGLRVHPVRNFEKHLIFYRPFDEGIELVRVLHSSRNVAAILRRGN
jgi:toxin ParE1/3/4